MSEVSLATLHEVLLRMLDEQTATRRPLDRIEHALAEMQRTTEPAPSPEQQELIRRHKAAIAQQIEQAGREYKAQQAARAKQSADRTPPDAP